MAARIRVYLACILVVAAAGVGGPRAAGAGAPSRITTRPDLILLIGIDTLRSDHLGAYGYFRDTMPLLDASLADQGVVFQDATSSTGWTFPANGAVHTGRAPFRMDLGWNVFTNPVPEGELTLAEALQQDGYHTAGFVTNSYASHYAGLSQGFDHYDDSLMYLPPATSGVAELLTDTAISWTMDLTQTAPLFLFTYYIDPHSWYNPPPPYDLTYDPTYTGTVTPEAYGNGNYWVIQSERDLEHLNALYDGEISYTDEQIGRLLAYLGGRSMLDNALIVVYADHGEEFGEHVTWLHGASDYEELLRVPLIMRYTGAISAGQNITYPVQTIDVMPTILDYAGIPVGPGLDGISLRPLIEGNPPAEPRPIYSEIGSDNGPFDAALLPLAADGSTDDLRGLRLGDWKYIHYVHNASLDELYQLAPASPYEAENLITVEPVRAQQMLERLKAFYLLNGSMYLPALFGLSAK